MFSFSQHFRRLCLLGVLLVVCASTATAQGTQPTPQPGALTTTSPGSIRGRVVLPNGAFLSERTRISLATFRGDQVMAFTDNQGQFQFTALPPGSYQLVIEGDKNRFETTTQDVEVLRGAPAVLTIVLKEKTSFNETKAAPRSVSTGELDPAIPTQAKKEFERASKASSEGKSEEAVTHLRKAIALYPGYLMAHNNLGSRLLAQGELSEAEAEFRRATEIDPKAFNPRLNLGITLVQRQRFAEAAKALEQALSLQPDSPSARLYLGLALGSLDDLEGSERELRAAHKLGGPAYAVALFNLGVVYQRRGDRQDAIKMFETYLREAPNAANAVEVKKLIDMLRRDVSPNHE